MDPIQGFANAIVSGIQGCVRFQMPAEPPDVRKPKQSQQTRISMMFDNDVLEWFRNTGRGYQKRMNEVLRWYINEMESKDQKGKD